MGREYDTEFGIDKLAVTFDNEFSKLRINGLTEVESNVLFTLIAKAKHKGTKEIFLSKDELLLSTGLTKARFSRVVRVVDSLWEKIKSTDYSGYVKPGTDRQQFSAGGVSLFSHLTLDSNLLTLRFSVNPNLTYFFNDFEEGNYTSFKLKDYHSTSGKRSKALFNALSQFNSSGWAKFSTDKLRYLLECPEGYNTSKFNKAIVSPAMRAVAPLFSELTLKKEKNGTTISSYTFYFKKKTSKTSWDPGFKKQKTKKAQQEALDRLPETIKRKYKSSSTREFSELITKLDLAKRVNDVYFDRGHSNYETIISSMI